MKFEDIKKYFIRYFFYTPIRMSSGGMGFFSLGSFGFNYNRSELSNIINKRIYLSNLPQSPFYTGNIEMPEGDNGGLLVSCLDIEELNSNLLTEKHAPKIKYHILAMEDVTAKPGCMEQIIDTILLMSDFADKHKPIHIHCMQGVGRSAMITALFIAYRVLLKDPIVIDSLEDYKKELENEGLTMKSLFEIAFSYVQSRRSCCQWDKGRADLAIRVLEVLQSESALNRDKNYVFISSLVQMPGFKQLQAYYHNTRRSNNWEPVIQLFDCFILNQEGWCQQFDTIRSQDIVKQDSKLCSLIETVMEEITMLAKEYPDAAYSQILIKKMNVSEEQSSVVLNY